MRVINRVQGRKSPLLAALVAGGAANAVDLFGSYTVYEWGAFRFGPILHFLIGLIYGPAAGFLTAVAGYASRYAQYGQLGGVFIPGADAFVIGWLTYRRGWRLIDAAAVWSAARALPVFALTRWGLAAPHDDAVIVAIHSTANLLLNAAVLQVLLILWTGLHRGMIDAESQPRPLRSHLKEALSSGIAVCFLVALAVGGHTFVETRTDREGQRVVQEARIIAGSLEKWLDTHRAAIVSVAKTLEQAPARDTPTLNRVLESVHKANPGFVTMIAADTRGVVVGAHPLVSSDEKTPIGIGVTGVADRDCFREPLRTGKPYVSGVFMGRGYFTRPIVEVSAPVNGPGGKPALVVEGTLELPALARIWKDVSPAGTDVVVVDPAGRVAYSSDAGRYPTLSRVNRTPIWKAAENKEPQWYQFQDERAAPQAWYMGARVETGSGWSVLMEIRTASVRQQLASLYGRYSAWAGLAVLLPLLLAALVSRSVTRPLEDLVTRLQGVHSAVDLSLPAPEPGMPKEVVELLGAFDQLWRRWRAADTEREQAMAELEDRVRARTAEMLRATDSAQKASLAKSEFLAMMSHEIRTPLNGVLGMLQILRDSDLTPDQREYADLAANSAELLLGVVGDVLDISKIEAGQLTIEREPFDLRGELEKTAAVFSARAAVKRLRFQSHFAIDIPPVAIGDSARLQQALGNLLSNAVKFTDSGTVSMKAAWVATGAAAGHLKISVSDTGVGIPAGTVGRLFHPFTQADASTTRRFGGTGLGLAITKRLVNLMGGEIEVVSEPGEGSLFSFWVELGALPGDSRLLTALPNARVETGSVSGGRRVLVVEDNAVNRRVAERMIEKLGVEVQTAVNGLEALQLLGRQEFDLILMDCQMPEMDGYQATAEIRRREGDGPRAPIIAMTAHAMAGDREKCLSAGMDDYLSKPVNLSRMAEVLNRYLGVPADKPQ